MKTLLNLFDFLKGKKAYIVGTLTIILGLLNKDTAMVLSGFSVITLRAGIAKSSL